MPDIGLRQSARFPRGQIQVTVPDLFGDWIAPIWLTSRSSRRPRLVMKLI